MIIDPRKILLTLLLWASFAATTVYASKIDKVYSMADLKEGVMLNGGWHFFWETTFEELPATDANTTMVNVPGEWNEKGYPGLGYGVFKRTVLANGVTGKRLAMYVPTICNNYNLYINGKKVASAGVFSISKADAIPAYEPKVVEFTSVSDTVEIVFEVSNYYYREGGINYNIRFGLEETIEKKYWRKLMLQSFSSGALFIMAMYFLCIFFVRKGEYVPLYFGLLCLVSCLRVFSTETILWQQFSIGISWAYLVKAELMSILLMPTLGMLYLYTLIEEQKYRWVMNVINSLSFLACGFIFFSTPYLASFIVPPFRYFAAGQLFFMLWLIYRAVFVNKHVLGRMAAWGYMILFVVGINDILYSAGLIHTFYAVPIAIFVYVIIQAIVLAKKSALGFDKVEQLTLQLSQVNSDQEKIINNRTQELNSKTKELEQYNSIKDKIFSIISHDLRAPIATLSSVLTLAEQTDDTTLTELRSYFKGIKRNVDNLNLTIENLLVWSQSQINGVKLDKRNVNFNNEVESVISLYGLLALQKEIVLMHRLEGQFTVNVDPAHLNLIMRNVISNSLKFTNIGGSIIISASRPTPSKVQICITDDGIGIQPERITQILNPTVHYSTSGTLNEKGTGLGLMLCKEYAEANGGCITIESSIGMGTKVCITLPSRR